MKFEVRSFVLLFVCWFFFVHNKLVLHYIIMLASSIKLNYNYCTYTCTLFVVSVNKRYISHCASRSLNNNTYNNIVHVLSCEIRQSTTCCMLCDCHWFGLLLCLMTACYVSCLVFVLVLYFYMYSYYI